MTEEVLCNGWIATYTGKAFKPLDPKPEDICIEDIAHALSLICRFTGHCKVFYSVAEHSIRCAAEARPEDRLWALLHDASEAYLADIARPVKERIPGYAEAEDRLLRMIIEKYGLTWPMPAAVKEIDHAMLMTERRDVMPPGPNWGDWCKGILPYGYKIEPLSSEFAETLFLAKFHDLMERQHV